MSNEKPVHRIFNQAEHDLRDLISLWFKSQWKSKQSKTDLFSAAAYETTDSSNKSQYHNNITTSQYTSQPSHLVLLSNPVSPSLSLEVILWVPVTVKDYHSVGRRKVYPESSSTGRQQEAEILPITITYYKLWGTWNNRYITNQIHPALVVKSP